MSKPNKDEAPTPTPRVGSLTSAAGVLREMARVYRSSRAGTLSTTEACKYVYMLQCMGRLYETVEIERRV